jgi:hypothetical protein
MNRTIERRLAALERRLMPPPAAPQVIIIRRVIDDGDPTFATVGGVRWERAPAESVTEFEARVIAAAAATGERRVIIGGLPR